MEQTKGYWRLEGKIWGLNNKNPYENDFRRSLSFGIQSSTTNSNYVQVGDWKNSKLNVKVKADANEKEITELNEQDAIDFIKQNFKDGDCVYINCRADVDTYNKRLNYIISQIYKKTEEIDFKSDDFKETNKLQQSAVIIEKATDKVAKVGVTNYKGEMIELDLVIEDDIIKDYMIENAKVGDLMHLSIIVDNRPIYEESVTSNSSSEERTTLKGKKIGGNNNSNNSKRIKERNLVLVLDDIDNKKTESKKYERQEIRDALEISNKEKESVNSKSNNNSTVVKDDDLPY